MLHFSLTRKFIAIALGLLLLWLLDFGALYHIEAAHHHVDSEVNAVGRLRMLAQRIGYRSTRELATSGENRADVAEMLQTWEQGLAALEHGGQIFGVGLTAPESAQQTRLHELRGRWEAWRGEIRLALTAAAAGTTRDAGADARIAAGADGIVQGVDAVLLEMTHRVERDERTAWQALVALIIFNLIVIIAGLLVLHRRLVIPLRALAELSKEYARGRFERRMDFSSADEIGDLSVAFNRMADQTMADLAQLRKLSQAVSHSSAGVVITDADAAIEYANPRWCELTGYDASEVIGANPRLIQSGQTPLEVYQQMWAALNAEGVWRGELLNRRKTGELVWMLQSMSAVRDDSGAIANFIAVSVDMTEHRRALQEVSRINRMLRLLSSCNETLIHAVEERDFVDTICRQIVELGGYAAAGVLCRLNGDGAPQLVGHAGDWRTADAADDVSGQSEMIVLPLIQGDAVMGELRFRQAVAESVQVEELRLLHELASDLAFGVASLRVAAARRVAEASLRLRERAIESSVNAIMIADVAGGRLELSYVNAAFERMTGYGEAEALGRDPEFLLGAAGDQLGSGEIRSALREKREGRTQLRLVRRDGAAFWSEMFVSPVAGETGEITHFLLVLNDISERVAYEEELARQTNFDALTGLANRNLLMDRLGLAVVQAQRRARLAAAIVIDIDHFKYVNDGMGHGFGDRLLREVAQRLAGYVRPGDTVARLGADEFVIVLSEVADEAYVSEVLERIQKLIAAPLVLDDHELLVTCSLGIGLFPRDGSDAATLLQNADAAMHMAKAAGRNQFQFFTSDINRAVGERLALEKQLRRAVESDQLRLHLQPQVDLQSGAIVGAEALVRWQHPERGLLYPDAFIPLAEDTGLIVPIGEWVLDAACTLASAWNREGLPWVSIAVNLSARQFRQKNLIALVRETLAVNDLDAGQLELEVTESMVMDDVAHAAEILGELKAVGVKLSLDDFGTGYSSLAYLKRFPIDTLKLDRSFVRDIAIDAEDAAIVRAVLSMSRSLNLKVVAEGVEDAEQLGFLVTQRCDLIQGYYFSRPLPAADFAALLRSGRRLAPDYQLGRAAILVVDDDTSARGALSALLADAGYAVSEAGGSEDALAVLERQPVNMVIADYFMPGMAGIELLAQVRARRPDIVRVLMSGRAELPMLLEAVNRGAISKFLAKPWQADEVRAMMLEGLGGVSGWRT